LNDDKGMQKKYDLIIFDWDGTLANSTQLIVDAICLASADVGLEVPTQQAASSIIGLGFREAVYELFGQVSDKTLADITGRYTHYYGAGEHDIPLFQGAKEVIEHLLEQQLSLAVATGKGRAGLNRALDRSGVGHCFLATRTVDECFSKPHPQMIEQLMSEAMTVPERTLMVGDTSFDLQMAQNAGVDALGVTFGAHPEHRLLPHEPLMTFDNFSQLDAWLRSNV
jgi:phosphoglycolate phosphatase